MSKARQLNLSITEDVYCKLTEIAEDMRQRFGLDVTLTDLGRAALNEWITKHARHAQASEACHPTAAETEHHGPRV